MNMEDIFRFGIAQYDILLTWLRMRYGVVYDTFTLHHMCVCMCVLCAVPVFSVHLVQSATET